MDYDSFGIGAGGPIEDAYLKVMTFYMMDRKYQSHDDVISEMAQVFGVEVQRMRSFIESNYAKAKNDPNIIAHLGDQPFENFVGDEFIDEHTDGEKPVDGELVQKRAVEYDYEDGETLEESVDEQPIDEIELRDPNQMWNGYCPESYMFGRTVRMRLNRSDFFESEETGLQIAVFRGVMAVILNFRGKGEFRYTEAYADEIESGELLAPQLSDAFPYHGKTIFRKGRDISEYIKNIPMRE